MTKIKSKKEVTVYLIARLGSSRAKSKNLRPFAGEVSIYELMCQRMKKLKSPFYAAVGEPELIDIAKKYGIPVALRSKDSLNADGPLRKIFEFIEDCPTSHANIISPCTPFLEPETIDRANEYMCQENVTSITSVTFEQNWYFGADKKPLFPFDIYNMNSKALKVYALANAFEIFPVKRFLDKGIYYTFENPEDPFLYQIPKLEAYDINSEEEFEIASYIWRSRYGKKL